MVRVKLSDFSDLAAATFWQTMQHHLRECRRLHDEATFTEIRGFVPEDTEELRQSAEAYSNSLTAMVNRYQDFKKAVLKLAPDSFPKLPFARCEDCLLIDARQAALACELIIATPMIPQAKRSKPMTKAEALNFIGWPAHCKTERQARDWLSRCIEDGEYRCEEINHKTFVFHIDDFPPEARNDIAKK